MYLRRVSRIFDFVILFLAIVIAGLLGIITRGYLILGALAFTAAYCLVALNLISQWSIWLPGYFPLGIVWLLVFFGSFSRHYGEEQILQRGGRLPASVR
jgi:hypothetical protein